MRRSSEVHLLSQLIPFLPPPAPISLVFQLPLNCAIPHLSSISICQRPLLAESHQPTALAESQPVQVATSHEPLGLFNFRKLAAARFRSTIHPLTPHALFVVRSSRPCSACRPFAHLDPIDSCTTGPLDLSITATSISYSLRLHLFPFPLSFETPRPFGFVAHSASRGGSYCLESQFPPKSDRFTSGSAPPSDSLTCSAAHWIRAESETVREPPGQASSRSCRMRCTGYRAHAHYSSSLF